MPILCCCSFKQVLAIAGSILRSSSLSDETINGGPVSMTKLLVGRKTQITTTSKECDHADTTNCSAIVF